jgi:hypothetical protein
MKLRTGRCYQCDHVAAVYEAHLDHDCTPVVLLCEACARWERECGSVVWIRAHPVPPPGAQETHNAG